MTRHLFGGDVAGYVFAAGSSETVGSITGSHTLLVPSQLVTFWNASSGGTQQTDLRDMTNTVITAVSTDANGAIPQLQGPDTTPGTWVMWADANGGTGPRRLMVATDLNAMDTQKLDVAGGSVTGPLGVSSGQASAAILAVTNTTSTPTVPAVTVSSASAGDKAFGVQVTGDTNRRLHADSSGVLAWGPGSATQDVNWYRIASGVVGTDNAVQTGTLRGSAAASGTLTLSSTGNATKGKLLVGTSAYDEATNRLGVATASPSWPLDVAGVASFQQGVQFAVATKTANYTATASDNVLLMSAASGSATVTLPTAVGIGGRVYTVKRTDSTTNTVTIATTSSQTIDGATTYTQLWAQYTYVTVISDGSNWQVIRAHSIPEPWQSISYAAQWADAGGGAQAGQYRRNVDKSVEVRGRATFTANGTTGLNSTSGTLITTLGSSYQPASYHGWGVPVYGSPTIVSNRIPNLVINQVGAGQLTIFNVSSVTTNGTIVSVDLNGTYWL